MSWKAEAIGMLKTALSYINLEQFAFILLGSIVQMSISKNKGKRMTWAVVIFTLSAALFFGFLAGEVLLAMGKEKWLLPGSALAALMSNNIMAYYSDNSAKVIETIAGKLGFKITKKDETNTEKPSE